MAINAIERARYDIQPGNRLALTELREGTAAPGPLQIPRRFARHDPFCSYCRARGNYTRGSCYTRTGTDHPTGGVAGPGQRSHFDTDRRSARAPRGAGRDVDGQPPAADARRTAAGAGTTDHLPRSATQ